MVKSTQEVDHEKVFNLMFAQNIRRLSLAPLFIIPISLWHIVTFYLRLAHPGTIEYQWRLGIIAAHSGLIFLAFLSWSIVKFLQRNEKQTCTPFSRAFVNLFFLLLLVVGVAIVVIDQWVTPSITPFLVICTILGVVFLVDPKRSAAFFILAYILFYLGLSFTQADSEILLSNRVNGFTSVGIGFFLSYVMWRSAKERIQQRIIIERQSADLEQKYAELMEQSDKLKSALTIKDRLFSIIGHDLRGPMAGIISLNDLMGQALEAGDMNRASKFNRTITNASAQVMNLLENLLDWSRAQSSTSGPKVETFQVDSVVTHCINVLAPISCQKTLAINKSIEVGEISSDANILKAVIRNLLSNAIKFSFPGGTIEIRAWETSTSVEFSVQDSGIGLTADEKESLFVSSKSTSRLGTNEEKGTGLGLIITKDLVKLLNGSIWAESEEGKGSNFYVSIPKHNKPTVE
ncbi:MAG: HAMP domain-containing sensor histidine kinase [Tenuifilaceae bacterium]|jgi:signal transduction histidine kinase|nr:HAMP domain-containing sensor histidine kinase [Tenuifilaceae bacterium]